MSKFLAAESSIFTHEEIISFQRELKISEVTATLLANRGISTIEQATNYLYPSLSNLHNPFELKDMYEGICRIESSITKGEKITIYGDYDVDGITSSAMLLLYLMGRNAYVDVYIPSRFDEGYGLNSKAIEFLHGSGTKLILTVDCGISALKEVELANSLGMDVIITDHHQCGEIIPNAVSIINPMRIGQEYPFKCLAGVGVASKLIQAMGGISEIEKYSDLIALGTVADIVPLVDENRILVYKGLSKINQNPCLGIKALIEVSGLDDKKIDTGRIAFGLAPRLNAAGRMATAKKGLELLISSDLETALKIAKELDEENRKRQELEGQLIIDVETKIESQVDLSKDKIIVVEGEEWHTGIIGIAASKITEKYHRPCILISTSEGEGTASARSIKGFDMYKALSEFPHLFIRFGGHEQAAGLTILQSNIHKFRQLLLEYADQNINDDMLNPQHIYDVCLAPGDISFGLLEEIEMMAPFGIGNSIPQFLLKKVYIESYHEIGKQKQHLKMNLGFGSRTWDAIGFDMASYRNCLIDGCEIDVLVRIQRNEWAGVSNIQLQIKQIKKDINNLDDFKTLLDPFYFKFFDAFSNKIMYNRRVADETILENYRHMKKISVNELKTSLSLFAFGNIIFVNTLKYSKDLLKPIFADGLSSRMIYSYGTPTGIEVPGVNALILAPDWGKIDFAQYRFVYLLEKELPFLNYVFDYIKIAKESIRIIQDDTNPSVGPKLVDEFKLNRGDMELIYRWLRDQNLSGYIWPNYMVMLSDYNEKTKSSINGFQFRLILEIFKELEFIRIDTDAKFVKISFCQKPISRSLNESLLYNTHKDWLRIIEHGNKLITNEISY